MKIQVKASPIGLGHPSVKRVLKIAEDIMNKNKVLNIENLYNLAKKSLKIPRRGLLSIIHYLIYKKILIEGSKFSKETVLSNQIRKGINNYIRIHPGVHFSNLRKYTLTDEIGSSGQLVWHLEMLLKFNYIKKIKVGNYTVFLPFEFDEVVGRILFLLSDRINNKILHALVENNSMRKSEIYKKIDEKREDVYYRIKNLILHNIIISRETSDKEICIRSQIKEKVAEILESSKFYTKK